MINSLKINNGSFANIAVSVQPEAAQVDQNSSVSSTKIVPTIQKQLATSNSTASPGNLPLRQVVIPKTVSRVTGQATATDRRPTFDKIIHHLPDQDFVLPLHQHVNNVVPVHSLTLDAGRTFDPRFAQGFATTIAAIRPYERLTGISQERPEIVMLTEVQPLFNRAAAHHSPRFVAALDATGLQQTKTDAGHFLDAQYNMKNLQAHNLKQMLSTLRSRFPNMARVLQERVNTFSMNVGRVKEDASFLLNLVRVIESQRAQLDLRHDMHVVDPNEVVDYVIQNFSQKRVSLLGDQGTKVLSGLVQQGIRSSYDLVDCLADIGYSREVVKDVFSSTKIWLQLTEELRNALSHHTLRLLDIDPSYQRNDKNATTILRPPTKYFELANRLPQLPTLDELVKLQVNDFPQVGRLLQPAYGSIYQNVFFKNEEARIAGLAHLVSREFRYSKGLAEDSVRQRLSNFYGFATNDVGNQGMFAAIMGRSGNNIVDMPPTVLGIASLAQRRPEGRPVLTFETKYVEGDVSTVAPGGEFYLDGVLDSDGSRFNTTRLKELSVAFRDHVDNFSIVCDALNLFEIPSRAIGPRFTDVPATNDVHSLDNSIDLVHELADRLINPRTGVAQAVAVNDRLGAVYSQARHDVRLKTVLFLYTLAKVSRTYTDNVPFFQSSQTADNTPLVDHLIDQLVVSLESTTPESRTTIQLVTQPGLNNNLNTSSLTNDSIRHALKSGTSMTKLVESFMSDILAQFRVKTQAVSSNKTRYSGMPDTILMMMAFDLAIALVARYSNQTLVGVHKGLSTFANGQTTYAISQTSTNHLSSFNELIQRLSGEGSLVRQMLLTVINSMRKLGGSLLGVSNYLESKEAIDKLQEISRVLGNDRDMVGMLLNEQQIMLLASTAENIAAATSPPKKGIRDRRGSLDFEVSLLDETEVSPDVHAALVGYFNTGELADVNAKNKRIMTVGIPQGFTRNLKQRIGVRSQKRAAFQNKRNDIVHVCVYKTDLQNSDIVYRPIKFMFELSRFPVRLSTSRWLPIGDDPSLNDIINAIPTQSFTQDPGSGTANSISSGIEYASTAIADSEGITGARAAFDDTSYEFLSSRQKAEILHNHVTSQLLESYIRLMTGIDVAEHSYHMVPGPAKIDHEFIKHVSDHIASHVADSALGRGSTVRAGGVLFSTTSIRRVAGANDGNVSTAQPMLSNPSGVAGTVSTSAQFRSIKPAIRSTQTFEQLSAIVPATTSLDAMGPQQADVLMAYLKTISGLSRTFSTLSKVDALDHAVLGPKQFDRVFNVLVDPRDFQVDVEKTMATPYGRQALELMIQHGDIVSSDLDAVSRAHLSRGLSRGTLTAGMLEGRNFRQGRLDDSVNTFEYRHRERTEGDLTADRYFVTIETYGEDEV